MSNFFNDAEKARKREARKDQRLENYDLLHEILGITPPAGSKASRKWNPSPEERAQVQARARQQILKTSGPQQEEARLVTPVVLPAVTPLNVSDSSRVTVDPSEYEPSPLDSPRTAVNKELLSEGYRPQAFSLKFRRC